jgi:hypothetical protein
MVERMTWLKDLHFDMIVLDEAQQSKIRALVRHERSKPFRQTFGSP